MHPQQQTSAPCYRPAGFGNDTRQSIGFITVALHLGKFQAPDKFYVIDATTSYHLLIGRALMHKFGIIPSTYHQCMKGNVHTSAGRKVVTIAGTRRPFGRHEAHIAEAEFFDNLDSEEDYTPPVSAWGIAIPRWE